MNVRTFQRALPSSFSFDLRVIPESGNATMSLVLKPAPSFKNQTDQARCRLGVLVLLQHGHVSKTRLGPGREGVAGAWPSVEGIEREESPRQ